MAVTTKLGTLMLSAGAAWGQYVVSARAGTIHFTTGEVFLDGQPVHATELDFPLMKDGQVLTTGSGRAEILLAPGVFLRLAEQSAIRMADSRLENTDVEIQKGTALVEVVETSKDDHIQIHFGETRTEFKGMGLFRFEGTSGQLRVFGGEAQVRGGDQKIEAGRGKVVRLRGRLSASRFDVKSQDDLHQWAASRSFLLFASSREARERRTHWETTETGWSWNRDFGMRLLSPIVAEEYKRKLAQEVLEKAKAQQQQDQLRQRDEAYAHQQQQQQQQPTPQQPAKKP